MPDNVGYTPGTGATVAADEISGALYQRMKLTVGGDGVNDGDVSEDNPLPVTDDAVLDMLRVILQALMYPVFYDRALNRQRATTIVESGSITVSGSLTNVTGTVGTLTNLTNMGSYGATQLVDVNGRTAWAQCVRSRIT
jgi:hypothetical protein